MAFDLANYAARIAAVYAEAFAAMTPAMSIDAVPYTVHWQESFPFVTVQLGDVTIDEGDVAEGEGFDSYSVTFTGRLYAAKMTDGYKGERETSLLNWVSAVIEYFNDHENLVSAAYPTRPLDLFFARVTGSTGFSVLQAPWAGEGVTAIGSVFTHEITALRIVEQDYN